MKRWYVIAALTLSLLTLLTACGGDAPGDGDSKQGTLSGTVTIGPVCPVEPCDQSPAETYVGRELVISRSGGSSIQVPLGEDGSFSVSLEPDTYVIRLDGCDFLGCDDAFPVEKTVAEDQSTILNVNLDTGIRSTERVRDIQSTAGALFDSITVTPGAPAADADAWVQAYLELMDKLAVALRQVLSSESQEASIRQVLTISSQLEEYGPLFARLDEEQRARLSTAYGARISGTAVLVAGLVAEVMEATGDDSIALALQRTPAFAIRNTSTEGYGNQGEPAIVQMEVPSSDINRLLSSGEVATLAGGLELTVRYRDQRPAAASVDPEQVEHMDLFASVTFTTTDGSRSLVLTAIDFDSEHSANNHLRLLAGPGSGMR